MRQEAAEKTLRKTRMAGGTACPTKADYRRFRLSDHQGSFYRPCCRIFGILPSLRHNLSWHFDNTPKPISNLRCLIPPLLLLYDVCICYGSQP
jgi:hypothetical protein